MKGIHERGTQGRVGGHRNHGYGKSMRWAGLNALREKYGGGHYATVAAHADHWRLFCRFAGVHAVKDTRRVTRTLVESYAQHLATQVKDGELAVSYAQNLLSSVNVILHHVRGDRAVQVSPREWLGPRSGVRTEAPRYLDRAELDPIQAALRQRGEHRVAAHVGLARELMLRFKESALMDTRAALREAERTGYVTVTEGTKGGRGRSRQPAVQRRVPVDARGMQALREAAGLQGDGHNLIPGARSYAQWREHCYYAAREVGMTGFHDLRAAGVCECYAALTGYPAPVLCQGRMRAPESIDRAARSQLMPMLGHSALRSLGHYIGGRRA